MSPHSPHGTFWRGNADRGRPVWNLLEGDIGGHAPHAEKSTRSQGARLTAPCLDRTRGLMAFVDVSSGTDENPMWRIALQVEGGQCFDQLAVTEDGFWLFPVVPGELPPLGRASTGLAHDAVCQNHWQGWRSGLVVEPLTPGSPCCFRRGPLSPDGRRR